MTYTDVFTGANIYSAEVTFASLALTGNVALYWPEEAQPNDPTTAKIVEIASATGNNLVVTMPDATKASTGETVLFNNRTAYTVIINDHGGTQIIAIPSSTQWQIYLSDNSTAAGTWRSYQFGAATSNANAGSLAGAGLVAISNQLTQGITVTSFSNSFTATTADRAKLFNFEGAGAGVTLTPPPAATCGNNWFIQIRNSAINSLVFDPPGSNLIDGLGSLSFQPGDSAIIACDGTNFFTIGLGQDPVFAFNYVTINISGGTDYVLSGSELNKIAYRLTGTLTANIAVIVPATVQQYWWFDDTNAGAYTVFVATQDQVDFRSPLALIRNDRVITYCDGADVVATQAASVSGSVNGGTF